MSINSRGRLDAPVGRVSRALIYRILDANFNRSREGLRVCEEVARFVLNDKSLTRQLKTCRHRVSDVWKKMLRQDAAILRSRDVRADVGRGPSAIEDRREDFRSLFAANSQRAKESLRALEETVKLVRPEHAKTFKKARFRVYAIEKRTLPKLEALCDYLSRISRRPVTGRTGTRSRARRRGRRTASR